MNRATEDVIFSLVGALREEPAWDAVERLRARMDGYGVVRVLDLYDEDPLMVLNAVWGEMFDG